VAAPHALMTLAQVQAMLETTLANLREMASDDGPSCEHVLQAHEEEFRHRDDQLQLMVDDMVSREEALVA
jgi:hypothetical protein